MLEILTCAICYQVVVDPKTNTCGHSYCSSCLQSLERHGRAGCCPQCKAPLQQDLCVSVMLKDLAESQLPEAVAEHRQAIKEDEERREKQAQPRNIFDHRDGKLLIESLRLGSPMSVAELTEKILEEFLDVDIDNLYGIQLTEAQQLRVWSGERELQSTEPVPNAGDLFIGIQKPNQDRINELGEQRDAAEVKTLQQIMAMLEKYAKPHEVSWALDGMEAVVKALFPAQEQAPIVPESGDLGRERGGSGRLVKLGQFLQRKLVQRDPSTSSPDLRALILEWKADMGI